MLIKVCGLKDCEQNRKLIELPGIDLAGFIFYRGSSRCTDKAMETTGKERVGVFVNASLSEILDAIEKHSLTMIQLHGKESPEFCAELSVQIKTIKAFGISSKEDFAGVSAYEETVDYFLFDTKTEKHGGSGKQFDWNLLSDYEGNTPFFISGGINPESAEALISIDHPKFTGADLNSRFETQPGIKDFELVKKFIESIKK